MKKFKVYATYSSYCSTEIEANTKEEAEEKASLMDGGEFESDDNGLDDGGWHVVSDLTQEIS